MKIIEAGNGGRRGHMTIAADMVNSVNICHGGVIFSFAQSTLAALEPSVGAADKYWKYSITFLNSSKPGDEITAEVSSPATTVFDVTVKRNDGVILAEMRAIC